MTPASARTLATVRAELSRLVRYDDESIVHEHWIRQRYDLGAAASYAPARTAAVRTAWHEAGHVVAALHVGARFSSASIRHGGTSQGRVHGVAGGGQEAFVDRRGGPDCRTAAGLVHAGRGRPAARLAADLARRRR